MGRRATSRAVRKINSAKFHRTLSHVPSVAPVNVLDPRRRRAASWWHDCAARGASLRRVLRPTC
eukprot:2971825-Prymnesium_polylepis.1